MGAYSNIDPKQTQTTLALLKHFRAFLTSDCKEMRDPYAGWTGFRLTKTQAKQKLSWLVETAINRKAGLPDPDRALDIKQRRDQRILHDMMSRPRRHWPGITSFETRQAQCRFGRALAEFDTDCRA